MTSEDFAEYGRAGVPAVLLHIGAVAPARLEEADARATRCLPRTLPNGSQRSNRH